MSSVITSAIPAPAEPGSDTAARILDVAERLVQQRGFNGFSYADVAGQLGVAKPSLHYHFAGKAQLGEALLARYTQRFAAALALIDSSPSGARTKLQRYTELYAQVLDGDRLCLCGMLAAEYETLPERMRESLLRFFDGNERWLSRVLHQGRQAGELRYRGTDAEQARLLLGALEGAMLVARAYHDPQRLRVSARRLVAALAGV